MPCLVILHSLRVDRERDQGWLQVIVLDSCRLQVAVKSVLVWGARMIGDLELGVVGVRVVVKVDIAALSETIV